MNTYAFRGTLFKEIIKEINTALSNLGSLSPASFETYCGRTLNSVFFGKP